jgi:glutamyl-tRNA reductase
VETAGTEDAVAAERLDRLIEGTTREIQAWLDGHARRAAAAALTERSDDVRAAVLAGLWRELPDLDSDAREAIDQMTRHLAAQLLREPLERLGRDVDGRTESAVREVFAL